VGAKTTQEIAEFVCDLQYSQLPPELVSHINNLAMGYLGMTLAGSVLPNGQIVTKYAKAQGAAPAAGVSGGGFRTSAEQAALVNATLAHATELEDVSFPDGLYSLAIFAPAFALGEQLKLPGQRVIEGFVVGYEVASSLGTACADAASKGWMLSAVFGSVGVAATAAKLLGLNLEQTANALSIGASQGTGIVRQSGTGAHTFEAGCAARNGICAGSLARAGLSGNTTILEGPGGMCDLIASLPNFEAPVGSRVAQVGIRKYPCCGIMQRNIDGMLDLIKENKLSAEEVESVVVEVNHTFSMYMKFPDPLTGAQTRFSIEHAMAGCFLEPKVFLGTFTDEKANDPEFKAFRRKVKMVLHPEWEHGYFPQPSPITVHTKDGSSIRKDCVFARGDAGHPLTDQDVMDKFMGCVDYAGVLSHEQAGRAAKMVQALDDVKDVSELVNIFSFPDKLAK